jgi:hypothetical protein
MPMPFRRSLPDALINQLTPTRFWQNLCQDRDLQPEIREDVITVYYRGGALLRELRLGKGSLIASIHPKFVPLEQIRTAKSIRLLNEPASGLTFVESLGPIPLGHADSSILKEYKRMMDKELFSFPEAEIVQAIYDKKENQILDQEIAFQEPGESRDKIDLCHFDSFLGKLVFVEVKRKDDSRLFRPEERPEVLLQLEAYCQRLQRYKDLLLTSYQNVTKWKRALGLEDRIRLGPQDGPTQLLDKPILVIGNCSSVDVRRIKASEEEWEPLMTGLKDVAAGVILCGTQGCRLNLEKHNQTIVF